MKNVTRMKMLPLLLLYGGVCMAGENSPVLCYSFEQAAMDDSGRYPLEVRGGAWVAATDDGNHVLYTGTGNGYALLSAAIGPEVMAALSGDYTISIDLCVGADNALGSFCWAYGLTNGTNTYVGLVNAAGNNGWYYEIKDGAASSVRSGKGLSVDAWHTVTLVQEGSTCTYYIDGVKAASSTVTLKPSAFGASLQDNYLGRSPFGGDAYMRNTMMDNFRVYDRALPAEEVAALHEACPRSKEIVLDAERVLATNREDLYLAQAVRYLHNRVELPLECTYGEVEWTFHAVNDDPSLGEVAFEDSVFTVTSRSAQAHKVGTLEGTVVYEGDRYPLYDEPLDVVVAPDDGAYGYLYCHMPNLVPQTGTGTLVSQTITYALGKKEDLGLVFNELNGGEGIIDGIGTDLPWCRDAFLAKDTLRNCYYIVTTDLYGSRDGGTSMLENYSIGMFRSYDLINWTYTRQDMKQYVREHPVTDIYDNSGTKLLTADKISRVWAPQIIFIGGDPYVYYAMGNTDNGDCDHFYISKANEDFTGITSLQMLYGANKQDNVLDADINYLETDGLYHMSYRDYAAGGILDITTPDLLNPQWSDPVSSFTDGNAYEASSVFRRINDDVWNIGNVNYGNRLGYHFHTADVLLRNLQPAADMTGHLSPQHGSFVQVTRTEYDLLQAWSDLKSLVAQAEALAGGSGMLKALAGEARTHMTTDKGKDTDLELLRATLQDDVARLGARLRLETAMENAAAANFAGEEGREGTLDRAYNGGRLSSALVDAAQVAASEDAAQWELSATALDEALQAYWQSLTAEATEVSVRNGDFSNGTTGWTVNGTAGTGNGVAEFFALRAVDYSVSLTQTVRNLETGYYLVKCQAFERNGDNDGSGRDYTEGVERLNYQFFAEDLSVPVRSLYALPYDGDNSLNGFANGTVSANALFSADAEHYANYLLVYVEDGRLQFGLRRPVSTVTSSDWCCFDNFQVFTFDDFTSVTDARAEAEKGNRPVYDVGGVLCGQTDAGGKLPGRLKAGVYIVDGQKIVKAE